MILYVILIYYIFHFLFFTMFLFTRLSAPVAALGAQPPKVPNENRSRHVADNPPASGARLAPGLRAQALGACVDLRGCTATIECKINENKYIS